MLRFLEVRLIVPGDVAGKAMLCVLFGCAMKTEDQLDCRDRFGIVSVRSLFAIGMRFSRPVAGFACHYNLAGRIAQPRVRRFPKLQEFRSVTGFAAVVANVTRRSRLGRLLPGNGWGLNGRRPPLGKTGTK